MTVVARPWRPPIAPAACRRKLERSARLVLQAQAVRVVNSNEVVRPFPRSARARGSPASVTVLSPAASPGLEYETVAAAVDLGPQMGHNEWPRAVNGVHGGQRNVALTCGFANYPPVTSPGRAVVQAENAGSIPVNPMPCSALTRSRANSSSQLALRLTFDNGLARDRAPIRCCMAASSKALRLPPPLFAAAQVDEFSGTVSWPEGIDLDPGAMATTSRHQAQARRSSPNGDSSQPARRPDFFLKTS